jgi:trans-aconitate methyltransferase
MTTDVRETYDRLAERYDQAYASRPETAAEDEIVATWLKSSVPVSASLLDLGCGTGWFLDQIGWPRGMYRGIDLSPAMVEQARCKHPGYTFEVGDAAQLWPSWSQDWRAGTPRWAVAFWSLNHLGNPAIPLLQFAASDGDWLAAVVRTPHEFRSMSAFDADVYSEPWTLDQIVGVTARLGLRVTFPLMFRYGGIQVQDWQQAHYLGMEVRREP